MQVSPLEEAGELQWHFIGVECLGSRSQLGFQEQVLRNSLPYLHLARRTRGQLTRYRELSGIGLDPLVWVADGIRSQLLLRV
jgi:hypothetical protein